MLSIRTIADFAPDNVENGVGLALQDESGRYLFALAGMRNHCAPGELFYAGVGGHREEGEDWLECAHREACEEIGASIEILPAGITWYIPWYGAMQQVDVLERPRPLAFYKMVYAHGTERAGNLYRIVIYRARLTSVPGDFPHEELQGIIALTPEQVMRGVERRQTLVELIIEGALLVGGEAIDRHTRLYPIGTAMALARLLRNTAGDESASGYRIPVR